MTKKYYLRNIKTFHDTISFVLVLFIVVLVSWNKNFINYHIKVVFFFFFKQVTKAKLIGKKNLNSRLHLIFYHLSLSLNMNICDKHNYFQINQREQQFDRVTIFISLDCLWDTQTINTPLQLRFISKNIKFICQLL